MIETISSTFSIIEETTVAERTGKELTIFEELMSYKERVFLICLGFSRNVVDAEDLTQEVYLKAFKNINTIKDVELSKFWLFRIARNTCLDFRKKHRPDQLSSLESGMKQFEPRSPESQMIFHEKLRSLKLAIQRLPKKQNEIFILREYGDLSYQEIAEVMKIKEGTVMSRLTRARRALLNRMKEE
ncbi:MAG: RNA polymerase sigma factor [Candidatus Aminicenantes bacterium]|nr:RNA polymerase sigma factor [Candidatus Aminicenantes bacterium]